MEILIIICALWLGGLAAFIGALLAIRKHYKKTQQQVQEYAVICPNCNTEWTVKIMSRPKQANITKEDK